MLSWGRFRKTSFRILYSFSRILSSLKGKLAFLEKFLKINFALVLAMFAVIRYNRYNILVSLLCAAGDFYAEVLYERILQETFL